MKKFVFASIASVVTFGLACSALAAMSNKSVNKPLENKAFLNTASQPVIKSDQKVLNQSAKAPIMQTQPLKSQLIVKNKVDQKQGINHLSAQKTNKLNNIK